MDNFKIVLEALIDQSSFTNIQKQAAKQKIKIGAEIDNGELFKKLQAIMKEVDRLEAKKVKLRPEVDVEQLKVLSSRLKDVERTYQNLLTTLFKSKDVTMGDIAKLTKDSMKIFESSNLARAKASDTSSLKESQKIYSDILNTAKQLNSLQTKQLKITPESNPEQWKTLSAQIDEVSSKYNKLWSEFWSKPQKLELFKMEDLNRLKELGYTVDETKSKLKDMLSEQAGKIQLGIETGDYSSKVQSLIGQTQKWADANGNARTSTTNLQSALNNLNTAYANITATGGNTEANQRALIEAEKALDAEIKKTNNDITIRNTQFAKSDAIDRLRQKYQEFYDKNTAAHGKWGTQMKATMAELAVGAEVPIERLNQLEKEWYDINNAARQAGKLGKSWFDSIKDGVKTFTQWTSATSLVVKGFQITKDMIQNVRDFDDSLLELVKVSDLSAEGLEKVADKAYDIGERVGRTGKQVVDAVTEFKRAGFELNDSMDMAESALVMTNVAEGIDDTADAAGTLISVLKGYNMSESETMSIVDKINQVSNTSPIGFDQIAEGLERTAGTMAQSGTTIDETIGLITAGYAQLRDVEKVSTSLITLSARLRGVDENGDVIDGLSAELQDSFGKIGVAIEDADGNLRSIYAIAKDYAEVLPTLSSKQKQYYAELAAGKRNVTTWNAITQRFQDAENAVAQSLNSVGSAAEENEKYLNSVSGKVTLFESAVENLSNSAIDSDFIKGIVDLGTTGVKGLDAFIEKFGMLTTLLTTGGLVAGIKNFGGHKILEPHKTMF